MVGSVRPAFCLLLASLALPAQQYFPPGVLATQGLRYAVYLKALHEPSLWELSGKDPKAEAYRFLWLRTFHHPISVRLVLRTSGSSWIHAHMTSGRGGYEPGGIARYSVSWMTKTRTQMFLATLQSTNFWNLPTEEPAGDPSAHWIIEGVKDGLYHVVERSSPKPGDPVRAFGLLALKLARFRLRPGEIY